MTHELKTWPIFFEMVNQGKKTFEVRKDDRPKPYEVGDYLLLREWNPEDEAYTGRKVSCEVTYILHGPAFGVEPGYVVMAINGLIRL